MTREEAIKILSNHEMIDIMWDKADEALNMAIDALEQQHCEDCISRKAVLDKIRAEIEQVRTIMDEEIINHDRKDLINFVNGLNQSLMIIDKYKAESEE